MPPPDKRRHNRLEQRETDWLARRQPVSGALRGMKGDAIHGDVLVDFKNSSGERSVTIRLDELEKLRGEALAQGQKLAVLLVRTPTRRYYVIDADDVHALE